MEPTSSYQQYRCPEEFQERLTEIGGVNRYDSPNFIVRWAQGGEDECYYRAGGHWQHDGFTGYRDLLVGGGVPCWMLMQWQDPLEYGSPEFYYVLNYNEETGLQDLGEYPYQGRYRLLYSLRWSEMRDGKLFFESMPLNSFLLETVVPIIQQAKEISWEKTKAAMLDLKAKEDAADIGMIEDVMRSSALPFGGNAVSYQKQGCRTALVDKKIEAMTRSWNRMMTNARALGRGLNGIDQSSALAQQELRRRAT